MDLGYQVYVVDDNRDAADSLCQIVRLLGHRATPFYDAASLLSAASTEVPQCVLLDIAMAGMDGLELANALRKRYGDDVILVAVTGSSPEQETVKQTFETVDHYFIKPVSLDQLKRLLRVPG